MAQAEAKYTIVLGGRVDNTYTKLGDSLLQLGTMANQVSQRLINLGKDSLDVYENYEKEMAAAKAALSTKYTDALELDKVMLNLDTAASHWAETSIFHTNEIAATMAEMGRAGLRYEDIMSSMPAVMRLAQAGGMDLATAFSLLNDSLSGMGLDDRFGYAATFVDQWTFAANNANTTIQELGEAFTRMGATAYFGNTTAEVLTMLDALANHGVKGSEAGTMLRNTMIRLVAPVKTAAGALEQLGVSSEDVDAAFEETGTSTAEMEKLLADLQKNGFSVFDESGKIKDWISIWDSLHFTLSSMFGEDYMRDQGALGILAKIFPTRTISGATSLLQEFGSGASNALYEGILNGSAGYGEVVQQIMNDTLYGKVELFTSKIEELKRTIGETLSPTVEGLMEKAGGFLDKVNGLDSKTFGVIVDGLTALAAVGPGLTMAGIGIRFFGYLFSGAGAVIAATVGVAEAAAILKGIADRNYSESFGNLGLDLDKLAAHYSAFGSKAAEANPKVTEYNAALEQSIADYEKASQTFTSDLLTATLTGETLTEPEITALQGLGDQMYKAVIGGIANSTGASISYWEALLGGGEDLNGIRDALGTEYDAMVANATAIGEALRNAITKALEGDGTISAEERAQIMEYVRSYNQALTDASKQLAKENDEAALMVMLHKAQSASLEDIQTLTENAAAQRDARLAESAETYEMERARLAIAYRNQGKDQTYIDAMLAKFDLTHQSEYAGIQNQYNDYLTQMWAAAIRNSDYWEDIQDISGRDFKFKDNFGGLGAFSGFARLVGDIEEAGFFDTGNFNMNDPAAQTIYKTLRAGQLMGNDGVTLPIIVDKEYAVYQLGEAEAEMQEYAATHPITVGLGISQASVGNNGGGTSNKNRVALYAEGGRADSPSIFGEAGAEWAIPEAHTAETARLLMQAAAASGFTWPEIAGAAGGYTLIYTPTIYAQDAAGVEEKLIADKERLDRYLKEKGLRDRAEVYA